MKHSNYGETSRIMEKDKFCHNCGCNLKTGQTEKTADGKKRQIKGLKEDVATLRAAVWNLQNLTRILERDICSLRSITPIGEDAKGSVLKAQNTSNTLKS